MLKIKPEFWTKSGGEQFVVLSLSDFEIIQELIEDAGLSRILRKAHQKHADDPGVSLEEVKRRLGMKAGPRAKAS